MHHVFEDDFDNGQEAERARDQSSQGHQAERKDRDIDQHADPEPDELAKIVTAAPLSPLHVANPDRPDILGNLEDQTIDVGIRRPGFSDLVHHETAQATKAAQIKLLWFFDDEVRDQISQAAAGIAPPGVFFVIVNAKDNVALLGFGNG